MSLILLFIGAIFALCAAGLAYLARVLRHNRSWRPGDELPDVPAGAAIRRTEWSGQR